MSAVHEYDYVRPTLYPKQAAAMFDRRRYSLIEASTKSGKTSSGIIWLFERALSGKPGYDFWWAAPVYKQARIAFRRMLQHVTAEGSNPLVFAVNRSDLTLTLANGSTIWFISGIHAKQVRFPEGPIAKELRNFEYELLPVGIRYGAPAGHFDDCVCALALAVLSKQRPKYRYADMRNWFEGSGRSAGLWSPRAARAPVRYHGARQRFHRIISGAMRRDTRNGSACSAIAWEAVLRLFHPEPVASGIVMIVAAVGIIVNGVTAALFASGRKGDLNISRGVPAHAVRKLRSLQY